MTTTRHSIDSWIDAGFDALRQAGPQALAAEPLARRLGTTKGSFYWHFKDVPAYHAAMLARWQAGARAQLAAQRAADGPADRRLRAFGAAMLADTTEPCLRVWAHSLPDMAQALAELDADRLTHLEDLLGQLGLRNPAFARAVLACLVGLPQIGGTQSNASAFDVLIDTVLALEY